MSSETVGASVHSRPMLGAPPTRRPIEACGFVSHLLDTLGVVALVATAPMLSLLVRFVVYGHPPAAHAATQVVAGLLMLATIVGLHLGIARWWDRCVHFQANHYLRWVVLSLPTLALLMGVWAIGMSGWGWLVALAGIVVLYLLWRGEWQPAVADAPALMAGESAVSPMADSHQEADGEAATAQHRDGEATEGEVIQRLERRLVDGTELLSIWQRVEFPAYTRTTTLHIPFWPPLPEKPTAESEIACEVGARVHIEQVELHGCRVKVQLDEADECPRHAEVEILFQLPASQV